MDAKPQKPLRSLRVFNDENDVPHKGAPRLVHNRHQSSPNLSALAASAALKYNSKRAAFGDVSNTHKPFQQPVKDDLALPRKARNTLNQENMNFDVGKKDTFKPGSTLLRPAQRPLKDSNAIKASHTTVQTVEGHHDLQGPGSKRLPLKKSSIALGARSSVDVASVSDSKPMPPAKQVVESKQISAEPIQKPVALPTLQETSPLPPVPQHAEHHPAESVTGASTDQTKEHDSLLDIRELESKIDIVDFYYDINPVTKEAGEQRLVEAIRATSLSAPEPQAHGETEIDAKPITDNSLTVPPVEAIIPSLLEAIEESTTAPLQPAIQPSQNSFAQEAPVIPEEPVRSSYSTESSNSDTKDYASIQTDPRIDNFVPAVETQIDGDATSLGDAQHFIDEIMTNRTSGQAVSGEEWYEEEEENFDDEGFVTARSARSRLDTFTGNLTTTLLAPELDLLSQMELTAAHQFVANTRTFDEIEDEEVDTTMVAEYGEEIFAYFRELERKMQPNPHYMDYQTEIQWSMRTILMDWIVQVHQRFNLLPETLFLTVNYVDRFLSAKVVSLNKLQLVGATALFVASKYEEINCPSVQEIVYMVDNGYTMEEVLKAERFMLNMLQFELGWPGPMSFLRRVSKADDYDLETRTLAKYLLEVTIMDEYFIGCPPSYLAAGAHCLARQLLKKGEWSLAHVHWSEYTYSQLHPLVQSILDCCRDPIKHHAAVYDKYQDKRFKFASRYVRQEVQRGFHILPIRSHYYVDESRAWSACQPVVNSMYYSEPSYAPVHKR